MGQMNTDGLYLKFGTERAEPMKAGEYKTYGELRTIEADITLTDLGTAAAVIEGGDTLFFPKGVRIEAVEVVNTTAATSDGSAVLNLGLIRTDRTTELDYDGLLAAVPLTDFNAAGEKKVYTPGVSGAGALVGTTTANPGYLTADYDTAAFTAGVIRVRVKFFKP